MGITTLNTTILNGNGGNVIIKKGESGGSTPPSGGESNIRYYSNNNTDGMATYLASFGKLVALRSSNGGNAIVTPLYIGDDINTLGKIIEGVAIDFNEELYIEDTLISIDNLLRLFLGSEGLNIDDVPTISKEEFYNLVK